MSYLGSAKGYLSQREDLRRQEASLAALRAQRDLIKARLAAIDTPSVSLARARELGLVQPGEVPIRVTGLDKLTRPAPPQPARGGGFWSWLPAL